jgi:PhzF family phenazine biosynthesis protein
MKVPYLLVDTFTETAGGGNRVALVMDARGMGAEEMQILVGNLGQSQAAFVTDWSSSSFTARFFAAGGEVAFSGHAAVALALTLARKGLIAPSEALYLNTISESLLVRISGEHAEIQLPTPRFRDPPNWATLQQFTEAMGANERYLHRGLPYGVAFTGLWSLFMPLVAPGLLDDLEPDMDKLSDLSASLGVAALHLYAPYGPRKFYARTFAPALGIPEDPVTGSANGALGALLARAGVVPRWEGQVALSILQGHHMGGPGQVDVTVNYGPAGNIIDVYIGGSAVLADTGTVELG